MHAISPILGGDPIGQVTDLGSPQKGVVSLDEKVIEAFAKTAVDTEKERTAILQQVEQPQSYTDPGKLIQLQQRSSNYQLVLSLLSTVVRKGVSAVESLLRT